MEHTIRVVRRIIWVPQNDNMIAMGVRSDTIKVEFDEEWSEMDWVVVHFSNKFDFHRAILENDTVTVPWELLLNPGVLYVTFVGYQGLDVRITTEQMSRPYFVNPSGPALMESPLGSSPDDMQYFLSIASECAAAEELRNKSEEQRRLNERVRIASEARRTKADEASQRKLALVVDAIHRLGALHSEIPYLALVGTLFDNVSTDAYEQTAKVLEITAGSVSGGVLTLGDGGDGHQGA